MARRVHGPASSSPRDKIYIFKYFEEGWAKLFHPFFYNRSQSIYRIVSVYRALQMQGGGHADVLMYFKCPPTQQVQYPVNAYLFYAYADLSFLRHRDQRFKPCV